MADIIVAGNTSGSITLSAPAISGSSVLTLPVATDTLVGKATTDTLTNKTLGSTVVQASNAAPAFSAYQSSGQTISTAAQILFQTEDFDTNNNFASSTFTPTVAGYYQVIGSIQGGSSVAYIQPFIYKNGSSIKSGSFVAAATSFHTAQISALVYMNGSSDYLQIWASQSASQSLTPGTANGTYFQAAMIRSA